MNYKYKIDKLIKMGKSHSLHCEDDYLIEENDKFIVAAVFDGCSSGIDSHYASTKHKYILKKAIQYTYSLFDYYHNKTVEDNLYSIINKMYYMLCEENYKINEEMLSTVVICFINKRTLEYGILFCGDGCCSINDEFISVHDKETNAVWYLSTLINEKKDYFDTIDVIDKYFEGYCKMYTGYINDINQLCISTDGIESFMTKYGSHDKETPIVTFFQTKKLNEKYHNWNMERLYNVMTKGKLLDMNKEEISNIDDLTIIKIDIKEDETEVN